MMRALRLFVLIFALALGGALSCASQVGVREVGPRFTYRLLNRNVLSGETPSPFSQQLLQRLSLSERHANRPDTALTDLHDGLGGLDESDRLFALAELSFDHAEREDDPQYYCAAVVYAYAFLFPEDAAAPSHSIYDPRLRVAMDLYNRALAECLRAPGDDRVNLEPRRMALPFGTLTLAGDPQAFRYGGHSIKDYVPLNDYQIENLRNQYRTPGIGATLSGHIDKHVDPEVPDFINPSAKAPVTVFLRLDRPRQSLETGNVHGTIELYDVTSTPSVNIGEQAVPLEFDPSLALAYGLKHSPFYKFKIAGFRQGDLNIFGADRHSSSDSGQLFFATPYQPGRIPVVLVHGTASSPAAWAEMINELIGDPNLASRYQFWIFLYNTGNPVPLSSLQLRESLQTAVSSIDPEGKDPALQKMVVVGHSQGGLLTKMTVVSSGDAFWKNISQSRFEMARLSGETKDLLRRGLFIEPLPFVQRVIFISTPHRGSFLAEDWMGKFARRFITLPRTITQAGGELVALNPSGAKEKALRIPTSIDNMDGSNPFLRTLASLPIDADVATHSIIPVKQMQKPLEESNDGVVRYLSAHIESVESEYVIRGCNHSAQVNPRGIEEVRRILQEHAEIAAPETVR